MGLRSAGCPLRCRPIIRLPRKLRHRLRPQRPADQIALDLVAAHVAEQVEAGFVLDALRAEGCDQVQGYWISRPGPIANFEGVVMNRGAVLDRGAESGMAREQAG